MPIVQRRETYKTLAQILLDEALPKDNSKKEMVDYIRRLMIRLSGRNIIRSIVKEEPDYIPDIALADYDSYSGPVSMSLPYLSDDLVFASNNPSAGYVSWVAGTLTYKGVVYNISASNSNNYIIYWDKNSSSTTFLKTNVLANAVGVDKWIVCYNDTGTAYPALAGKPIPGQLLVDTSVITEKLANLAVTAAKIATGTITSNEIAALSITAANIAALTITADKIAANTITASKIAANTITAACMAANSIATAALQAGCITAASGIIADLTVGTLKIIGNAVSAITNNYYSGAVTLESTTTNILSASITTLGNPVEVTVSALMNKDSSGTGEFSVSVIRDSGQFTWNTDSYPALVDANSSRFISFKLLDNAPSAGAHTYYFKGIGGGVIKARYSSIVVMELRR